MSIEEIRDEGDSERERLIRRGSSDSDDLPLKDRKRCGPVDRCYLVYGIFFILGVGSLLPWNFFSNAKQYFLYKLRNTTIHGDEAYTNASLLTFDQVMFETYLELAAQIPCVLFVFINMLLTKVISAHVRIISSISLMIALFVLTISIVKVDCGNWQHSFLVLSLVTVSLMSAGSAVLQGAICGLASLFPKLYMQAVFSGMGFGGLTAALANLATIGIGSGPEKSGLAYFLIAEFILLFCLVGYLVMSYMRFVKFYTRSAELINTRLSVDSSDSDVGIVSPSNLPVEDNVSTCRMILNVLRKIWMPAFSILIVFFASLACYPAVMSAIQPYSKDKIWATKYFTPVTCFVIFNLTDFIGRNLAGVIHWPRDTSPGFLIACILRCMFIPLFLLCNVQPKQHSNFSFSGESDVAPIVLGCLFGLSNGYMGTLSMMHAPRLVPEGDVEMAGSMMAFFLSLGLGLGALLSTLLVNII